LEGELKKFFGDFDVFNLEVGFFFNRVGERTFRGDDFFDDGIGFVVSV